ncbi:protein kinase domain-containing protein [Nocardia sp. NBC_00416]|uniref:protein kinase domain-containing protein n=1 Tax=Nocardia sp. NBC_00416 TaxID=2975991 RepID=UPI003FA56E68
MGVESPARPDPGESDRISEELSAMGLTEAQEIGRGGFGVVYRCVQRALDRVVAVKVLSSDLDSESRERFLREEHAMGRLSGHPNIVDILQVDMTASGLPFIVMPFATHGSLERLVHDLGPLGWADTVRVGVKLAGAIESAHRTRILHRDVKPANVLLSSYGEPQLTDFGIARMPGGFRTSSSQITGSPAFTAPEVLKGAEPTVRSDVYGLGATLFALVTGHAAFERQAGERVVAQFLRITTQPVPDLREQDIPADVAAVIEQAMAQDPQERPASAYEFGEMLRAVQTAHDQVPDQMALLDPEVTAVDAAVAPASDRPVPAVTARRSWPFLPPTVSGRRETDAGDAASPFGPASGARRRGPSGPRSSASGRFGNAENTQSRSPATLPPSPATKFRPPTPPREPVRRPRLLNVLRDGVERRLTVIHAPAGFGKSVLAAQWRDELAGLDLPVAWIGIDSGDDNEVWFLAHLIEAINRVRPEIGSGLGQMLEERPADTVAYAVSSLIDELHTSGEPVVVIIDDWHRLTDPGALRVLSALLDSGCHHLRFVVTSRDPSDLPIGRMRMNDELVQLDSEQLRLTRAEVGEILVQRNGFELDTEQLDRIYTATDGWPAAIQLISLALRDDPDPAALLVRLSEGGHGIREYLAENVLDTLEPEMLEFLSDIAVTEQANGSLAIAVTGNAEAPRLLEQAERRELFVRRTDEDPEWFRMQPLFAEYLRARLDRTSPGRAKTLHRRAARWYAEHQLLRKSVDHSLAGTDFKTALDLLESGGMDLIDGSRVATLLGSVSKLPVQQVASRSKLLMAVARANVNLQQSTAARSALNRLSNVLSRSPEDDGEVRKQRCQADVLAASDEISHDRSAGVLDQVSESLRHPDELPAWTVATAANINAYVRICEFDYSAAAEMLEWARTYQERSREPLGEIFAWCGRGIIAYEQLDIPAALRAYQQAYKTAQERSGPRSHGVRAAAGLLGELEYRRGDLAAAEALFDESYQLVARIGPIESLISTIVTGARVKALHGDLPAAAGRLAEGSRIAADHQLTRLAANIRAEQIRLGIVTPGPADGPGSAGSTARGIGKSAGRGRAGDPDGAPTVLNIEADEIAVIRTMLVSGDRQEHERAARHARALYGRTREQQRPRAQLDMTLLLAECLAAAGWVGESAALLAPTVATCAELGWTRPLLDAGSAVREILRVVRDDLPVTTPDGTDTVRTLGEIGIPIRFLDELLS